VSRAVDLLFKAVEALLAALLVAMVVMVFGNVVLRYVFNSGITVSEELSRFCFVWLTFIGAVVAMRDGGHLGMDTFVARLQRRGKLVCLVLSELLVLACCAMFFWGTWRQHEINATNTAPVTGLSMIWVFGVAYVTSLGIGALSLHKLWRALTGQLRDDELVMVSESEEALPGAHGAHGAHGAQAPSHGQEQRA
jgi:TRAP-type C4-dicarboxylate transport system permease small subunit